MTPVAMVPTVLAVDDDSFMRELLRHVFAANGIALQTFASASELLASNRLHEPAVLLLDVMMPGMTGLELQALLRERGITLPVIFLTGSADVPMAVEAMRGGAVDFLQKPFNTAMLADRVRRAFARCAETALPPADDARADDHARRLDSLTPREREVYDLMILGKTSKLIAAELGGSYRTIEIHRGRVMEKMAAVHLADLVRSAFDAEINAGRNRRPAS